MEAKTQTPTVQESSIVERVARIVSSVRGAKPDYTLLAAELEPAIPFDVFGVVLLRHDRQAVRVTACHNENGLWCATYHQHPLEGSRVEQLLLEPAMSVTNYPAGLDGPPAQCGDALSGCYQLHATVIAPLIVGERVLGALELGSTVLNAYADSTLQRLIGAVVHVLAAAIESAQVGGSAEIQDRQRQALKDVSSALTSKMDLPSILTQIVEGVAKALHVASAIVTFEQGGIRLKAQSGLNPSLLQGIVERKDILGDQSIIGFTLRHRQPCVSNDIFADERFPYSRLFSTELGIHSIFSHPLMTGTTVYGALLLCSSESGGFTPLKADILSLFASQATIAIHNGILIESAHQRSRFQNAIEQLERTYAQNADEHEMLAHVRSEAEQTFGVSFSSLLHFISDHLLTRGERELQAMLQAVQQEAPSLIADTASPEPVAAPSAAHSFSLQASAVDSGTSSMIAAPSFSSASFTEEIASIFREAVPHWQDDGVALLTQTAETALARVQVLSELGRLLTQFNQAEHDHFKDAWFVVDLNGMCVFMNRAAEAFCGLHMSTATESKLEDIFGYLLPRIRNAAEVRLYLQDFSQGMVNRRDLRCVLAIERILGRSKRDGDRVSYADAHNGKQQGRPFNGPSLLPDSAPSDHHYQLSRYPLYNQQNVLIANVLQVHDVTEQVHEEKNKSALLSSVSHDLRTPLTTIKAAVTGLLQEGVEWDEEIRREILEDIDVEADHLAVLVNDLVEMSRIEMGALILEKEWCDIIEIVHGAMIRLERTLVDRTVRLHIQPNLPLIYADHVQMERVFYNLIEYAARHSSSDQEILLSFEMRVEATAETPHHTLCVKIINQGQTVPISERERIFKTFYGLNIRGSGLGLAICRGIVEAHQGHIGVETALDGNGSCFVFTLPMNAYSGASSGDGTVSIARETSAEDAAISNMNAPFEMLSISPNDSTPTMEGQQ